MANTWITHVKAYAEKKKMKYTDAMKSVECKSEYDKIKPKSNDEKKQEMNKNIMKNPKKVKNKTIIEDIEIPKLDMVDTTVKIRNPRISKPKDNKV